MLTFSLNKKNDCVGIADDEIGIILNELFEDDDFFEEDGIDFNALFEEDDLFNKDGIDLNDLFED